MKEDTGEGRRSRSGLKKKGVAVGMKMVSKVLEDPERAKTVIGVFNRVQRSKERMDDATHRMLNAGHLPSCEDLARISRHVGALRREVRRIKTRLESIRRKVELSSPS